uniref:OBG-type G domain-containing protein n=1 Tax=Oryza punctata TaxID=4537 RepID=A0A0E0KK98_ORYPU
MAAALVRSLASRSRMGIRAHTQLQPKPAATVLSPRLLNHGGLLRREALPPPPLTPYRFFSSGGFESPRTGPSPSGTEPGTDTESCTYKQGPVTAEEKNKKCCPRKQASMALGMEIEERKKELLKLMLQMKNIPHCDDCFLNKEEQWIRFLQGSQASEQQRQPVFEKTVYVLAIISLIDVPEYKRKKAMALSPNIMRDASDKVLIHGQPGEEVSLELTLRVVADVGLVGLPNAGKSTLLSAITLARPDIADYPFTTLMPNLGRLGGDPSLGALQFSSEATLADLPGLIEGAHLGKGLGRNFSRHLRRTRVIVHVVDAAADDPVDDYKIVREELRMYNPQYLERPYVVVLNKIDLPKAQDRLSSLAFEISSIGCEECDDNNTIKGNLNGSTGENNTSSETKAEGGEKELRDYPIPQAVVGASVLKHIGIDEMLKEIRAALGKCFDHRLPEP